MAKGDDRVVGPVVVGVIALAGVALVVGAIMGGAALVGSRALGLSEPTTSASASGTASLFLPKPSPTGTNSGPLVTITPGVAPPPTIEGTANPSATPTVPSSDIVLNAGQSSISPGQQIDLNGTDVASPGSVLQVERFLDGSWGDFSTVTATVRDDGSFSTYIITSQTGQQRLRMRDTVTDETSNEVKVQIG